MKKTLLVLAFLFSCAASFGQVKGHVIGKYDSIAARALVTPYQFSHDDTDKAAFLAVQCVKDNFSDAHGKAVFQWQIYSYAGNVLKQGIYTTTPADYDTWDGGNSFPFTTVSRAINKPIRSPEVTLLILKR